MFTQCSHAPGLGEGGPKCQSQLLREYLRVSKAARRSTTTLVSPSDRGGRNGSSSSTAATLSAEIPTQDARRRDIRDRPVQRGGPAVWCVNARFSWHCLRTVSGTTG